MTLFPFSRFKVFGHSMLPTLKEGQEVLTFNWWKLAGLKVGDMVVIKVNGQEMVKRIHLRSRSEGKLCLYHGRSISVLGDNEKDSLDSRKFGAVRKEQIIGKVIWQR